MPFSTALRIRTIAVVSLGFVMAGCAAAPPVLQATQAAPPPIVAVPPLRPEPPFSASLSTEVPQRDVLGNRQTINTGLNTTETLWNLRSAWNVAALNCLSPRYQPITDTYRSFLEDNSAALAAANAAMDEQFRVNYGGNYKRTRDTDTTRIYNYFALPPARFYFCESVLGLAQRYQAVPPSDIESFAIAELPQIEGAFERFYIEFEQFQRDVVAWDNTFGPEYGAVYAPVAVPQPTGSAFGEDMQSMQVEDGAAE